MKKFIVLMSHDMSDIQKDDAYKNLGVHEIIEAPKDVKSIWSNINPVGELDLSSLDVVVSWIDGIAREGDFVLVQGEFGATFYVVDYCMKSNLIPVYATSVRKVEESREGEKVITKRVFAHEGFRKYKKY